MSDERDISLTPSDVYHETAPHIVKPPGYRDIAFDDDVNFDDVASPPYDHDDVLDVETGHNTAKQDENDVGPEGRSARKGSPLPNIVNVDMRIENDGGELLLKKPTLDRDVVTDGLEKGSGGKEETRDGGENEEENEREVEGVVSHGAVGGNKGRADKKREEQGGSDSWIVLNKDGEVEYCLINVKINAYRQLRATRALSLFNDVSLRTRRALSLYKVYGDSALLVLSRILLNIVNSLLVLSYRYCAFTFLRLLYGNENGSSSDINLMIMVKLHNNTDNNNNNNDNNNNNNSINDFIMIIVIIIISVMITILVPIDRKTLPYAWRL